MKKCVRCQTEVEKLMNYRGWKLCVKCYLRYDGMGAVGEAKIWSESKEWKDRRLSKND